MKIAHITTVHAKNDNRIFYKECTTLQKEGYDVTLIVAGAEDDMINGVKVVGFPKHRGRLSRFFKTSFLDLLKLCKEYDMDIYHFHDPEIIFVGLWLKLRGKKVIYDIHENNPASILSKTYIKSRWLKYIISKGFDLFERFVVGFFDAIVTARPDISKRFKHKHVVTLRNFPILPDLEHIQDIKIEKSKLSVIFVGGMTNLRGLNQLLDAFETMDDVELWLLGPIVEKELEKRIKSSPEQIKYFGIVEAYDVFSYIQKSDIGIITFLPAPNHIETLATKPFEYMACGKPMIMSNFEYWKKTFGDSSLYVDPSKPKEIVKTVKVLLENKDLMLDMGRKNLQLSQNEYNWKEESQKLLELYEKLGW